MDIKTSKSIFAKLLAQEDLKVHHAKVPTASFDTRTRTLTLPIWTDMDGDLYDLLCGHEVGHALYTPAKGWHDAICGEDGDDKNADMVLKGFLNVLEDCRIEKKIKAKYPGLRANFYKAYQGLHDKDFFQIRGKDTNEMLLIDRINLHFKLGSFVAVQFSEAEKSVIKRVENLETWEQVEALARELMAMCKKELEEKKTQIKKKLVIKVGPGEMSDDPFEKIDLDDYDEIEYEFDDGEGDAEQDNLSDQEREMLRQDKPVCETDRAFREQENLLLDHASRPYEYATVPTINSAPYTVSYKKVLSQMVFDDDQETYRAVTLANFKKKNDKVVNYLVKEFELRRNAEQLARAKTAKSGEIDVKRVFSYKYNEDLFKRITTVPNGKSHGLILFFDMSGSMSQQMGATLEQMIVLVEFCRKVNIPFEVYGFTNGTRLDVLNYHYNEIADQRQKRVVGEIYLDDNSFHLRQYFSDTMRPTEYKQMVSNLTLLARVWHRRAQRYGYRYSENADPISMHLPDSEELNGTPLNQSILLSIDIYNKFVERTKSQIVNMAFLTDGDTDDSLRVGHQVRSYSGEERVATYVVSKPDAVNVVLTHKETRKSVIVHPLDRRQTRSLVSLIREVTGANIVCFDIVASAGRGVVRHKLFYGASNITGEQVVEADSAYKKFKKDRILVIDNQGFNEYYLIPGGSEMNIDDDELEVEDGADKKKIFKAFAEMQNDKKTSRILLNRFIKMIA